MSHILGTHPHSLRPLAYPATFSHGSFDAVPYPCLFLGVLAPARAILQTPQVPKSERSHAIYISIRVGTFDSLNLYQLHNPKRLAINGVSHTTRWSRAECLVPTVIFSPTPPSVTYPPLTPPSNST